MMLSTRICLPSLFAFGCLGLSCQPQETADAFGNFEANSLVVSAKGNGELLWFVPDEGVVLTAGKAVGLLDTTVLHLERQQILAREQGIQSKTRDPNPQIAVLVEQQRNLQRERDRALALVEAKAATSQQLDELTGQLDVVKQQIVSAKQDANSVNRGILSERDALAAQMASLDQRILDQRIVNPIAGTVLTAFVENHEYITPGKPLYKVAALDQLTLRAYTSASMLDGVQVGQQVRVLVDDGPDDYRTLTGQISWIASEAEFTPKSIQTKEDRVSLVYALEVAVTNDGTLRIGMPGEVMFDVAKPVDE